MGHIPRLVMPSSIDTRQTAFSRFWFMQKNPIFLGPFFGQPIEFSRKNGLLTRTVIAGLYSS